MSQDFKLLIVDDDPKLLKMLQRTLIYENLNVLTASDGLDALPLVSAQNPDLIIVDWMMPRMDGWEVLHRIRQMTDVPVIMVTVLNAGGHEVRARRSSHRRRTPPGHPGDRRRGRRSGRGSRPPPPRCP